MSVTLTPAELAEQEEYERITLEPAIELSKLIPESFVTNDGGGSFIYIPFYGEVNNDGDEMHATVAIDQNDDGSYRNWTIQYDFGVEVWESEFDYTADPAVVAVWVDETLKKHRA